MMPTFANPCFAAYVPLNPRFFFLRKEDSKEPLSHAIQFTVGQNFVSLLYQKTLDFRFKKYNDTHQWMNTNVCHGYAKPVYITVNGNVRASPIQPGASCTSH